MRYRAWKVASRAGSRIARGTEDSAERVDAGDRQLFGAGAQRRCGAALHHPGRRVYDRRVPLYIEAEVALDELYTQGYLAFAFRRAQPFARDAATALAPTDSACQILLLVAGLSIGEGQGGHVGGVHLSSGDGDAVERLIVGGAGIVNGPW